MRSVILETATRVIMGLLIVFSVFLLWRGHNDPGGGFAGGLVLGGAFALYGLAYSFDRVRSALRVDPRAFVAVGLLVAVVSGLVALLEGAPFMTGQWTDLDFGPLGHLALGTPLLFDVGVYFVVFGVILTVILSLSEEVD